MVGLFIVEFCVLVRLLFAEVCCVVINVGCIDYFGLNVLLLGVRECLVIELGLFRGFLKEVNVLYYF